MCTKFQIHFLYIISTTAQILSLKVLSRYLNKVLLARKFSATIEMILLLSSGFNQVLQTETYKMEFCHFFFKLYS